MFASLKRRLAQKNRRIKQELAQKYGHAEVTDDDDYLQASKHFLDTENSLQSFAKNVDRYCSLLSELTQCQANVANDMLAFCDKDTEAYNGIKQYADTLSRIQTEHTVTFTNMLKEDQSNPLNEHLADLVNVKDMMEKRVRKKTDMDYYKQKLATLQSKGKNEKLGDTEDKLRAATVIYNQASDGLMDWFHQVSLLANSTACQTSTELMKGQKKWMYQCQELLGRIEPEVCNKCVDKEVECQNWIEATANAAYKTSMSGTVVLNGKNEIEEKSINAKMLFSTANQLGKAFTSNFLYSYSHSQMHLKGAHLFTTLHQQTRPSLEYMVNLTPFDKDTATIHVPRNFRYSMVELQPLSLPHNHHPSNEPITEMQIESLQPSDVIVSEFHTSAGYLNTRTANLNVGSVNSNNHTPMLTPVVTPVTNTPATIIEETSIDYVQAIYPFKPTRNTEMALKPGEVILVKRKHKSGWWLGECAGIDGGASKQGYFPSNYTKPMDKTEKSPTSTSSNASTTSLHSNKSNINSKTIPLPSSTTTPTHNNNTSINSPILPSKTNPIYGTLNTSNPPPPPPPPPANNHTNMKGNPPPPPPSGNAVNLRPTTITLTSSNNSQPRNNPTSPPPISPNIVPSNSPLTNPPMLMKPTQPQPSQPRNVQNLILASPQQKPVATRNMYQPPPPPPSQLNRLPSNHTNVQPNTPPSQLNRLPSNHMNIQPNTLQTPPNISTPTTTTSTTSTTPNIPKRPNQANKTM